MSDSPCNRSRARASFAFAVTVLGFSLASSSASAATVTIGQINPFANPVTDCNSSPFDNFQPTVTSGPTYVVPPGGAKVISWTVNAGTMGAGSGQQLEMKFFRKVADPATYKVVGQDGPRLLAQGLNNFSTNLAVQPGDVLGLNDINASISAREACEFGQPGDSYLSAPGNLNQGDPPKNFAPDPDERLSIQAVVQLAPGASPTGASAFSFGKTKDNHKNGTATITVDVPGPGTVGLTGKGVKTERIAGAVASKTVSQAGAVKLLVKPKGKTKHKLAKTGKAKVKVNVTYTPSGGNAAAQSERVKLIKKR
jgi:hypothetical protein